MKSVTLLFISILSGATLFAQEIKKLDYCNCIDVITQTTPILNGEFERKCNGKVIEKGSFVNGKKDREWVSYNKKGKLIAKINYENGLLSGKVELFYSNNKPKLVAEFNKGTKIGNWQYFTKDGKVFVEGNYEYGKPIDIWTIKDKNGKNPVVQYNFSTNSYLINKPYSFYKDGEIIQNDNTEEWYILKYPQRTETNKTAPLGGFHFASDLFVNLMEVPIDYWDTFGQYEFEVDYWVNDNNITEFTLKQIDNLRLENNLLLPFLIITNPKEKIKDIQHSELSKELLVFKINEVLNFMPPFIYKDLNSFKVYIPYVINKIEYR